MNEPYVSEEIEKHVFQKKEKLERNPGEKILLHPQIHRMTGQGKPGKPSFKNLNPFNKLSTMVYIQKLPIIPKDDILQMNESKPLFFELAPVTDPLEGIYISLVRKFGKAWFCDLNCNRVFSREMNLHPDFIELSSGDMIDDFQKTGWFILHGKRFGFLLAESIVDQVQKGCLPTHFQKMLKYPKFAQLMKSSGETTKVVPKEYDVFQLCPMASSLFPTQRETVMEMYDLECQRKIQSKKKEEISQVQPFLGSSYYLDDSEDGFRLLPLPRDSKDESIPLDGNILVGKSGCGKTVSMIALMTIGSQLRQYSEAHIFEEEKRELQQPDTDEKEQEIIQKLSKDLNGRYDPTLIVVKPYLLHQWKEEIGKFAPNLNIITIEELKDLQRLQFCVNQKSKKQLLLLNCDVLLLSQDLLVLNYYVLHSKDTAYSKLHSDREREEIQNFLSQIMKVNFRRLVLDELQDTLSSFLTCMPRRFNGNFGVKSYLYFFECLNQFQRDFTWGLSSSFDSSSKAGISNLLKLKTPEMKACIPLVCKNVPFDGKTNIIIHFCSLHPNSVEHEAKVSLEYMTQGIGVSVQEVGKNYLLAQFTDNLDLIKTEIQARLKRKIKTLKMKIKTTSESRTDLQKRLQELQKEDNFYTCVAKSLDHQTFECPICLSETPHIERTILNCLHQVCATCYSNLVDGLLIKTIIKCPICMKDQQVGKTFKMQKTRLPCLFEVIHALPVADKMIVFLQYEELQRKLEEVFTRKKIEFISISNRNSSESLRKFRKSSDVKILLFQINFIKPGVNIPEANHILFLHPLDGGNDSESKKVYEKCISTVSRVNQKKPVYVRILFDEV